MTTPNDPNAYDSSDYRYIKSQQPPSQVPEATKLKPDVVRNKTLEEQKQAAVGRDFGHEYSDRDFSADSLHHTLGPSPAQAAPGNHDHGIQTGVVTVTGTGATNASATVTFSKKYKFIPKIMLTKASAPINGLKAIPAHDPSSVSVTGFTVLLYNGDGTVVTNGVNIDVEWLAIGTLA